LDRHINKKNPCIKITEIIKPKQNKNKLEKEIILLEIQKEKSKQKEEDRKFQLEIQKEKARKKELDLAIQKEKKLILKQKEDDAILKREEVQRIRQEKFDIWEMEIHRDAILEFEREQRKIQLEEEKRKRIELKIQLQQEKAQLQQKRKELEYSRSDKKSRDNMTYIKMYAENAKNKLEKKKEIDLEIIKAKAESMRNIEIMKNERKEQTPQIINNNVTINNINICINYIKEHHLDKLDIDFNQMQQSAVEYFKENVTNDNTNISAKHLISIFNKYDTCNGIMDHILRMAYNNLERENKRCVWYMKDPEYYFAGTIQDNIKNVKLINFDKDLFPLLKSMLSTALIKITAAAEKYVKMTCDYENEKNQDNFIKHKNLLYYQRNVLPFTTCLSDIKKMSDKVFEIESPSELPISL